MELPPTHGFSVGATEGRNGTYHPSYIPHPYTKNELHAQIETHGVGRGALEHGEHAHPLDEPGVDLIQTLVTPQARTVYASLAVGAWRDARPLLTHDVVMLPRTGMRTLDHDLHRNPYKGDFTSGGPSANALFDAADAFY